MGNEFIAEKSDDTAASDSNLKKTTCFSDNPYCKAIENATDVECMMFLILFTSLLVCVCVSGFFFFFFRMAKFLCYIAVDRLDTEGNAHAGPVLRLPFASLFDTLGV